MNRLPISDDDSALSRMDSSDDEVHWRDGLFFAEKVHGLLVTFCSFQNLSNICSH